MTPRTSWMAGLLLGFMATAVLPSCDKDDDDDEQPKVTYQLSGAASGAKEVPPVITNATGTLSGTYNRNTNKLEYTITWNDLSGVPTMMHFHGPASATENASPVVNITGFTAAESGTATGTADLTDEQETQLLDGKWYYNIHTPDHGGGEIRSQVDVQ